MEEAISFFRAFEIWVYVILGIGGAIYIRKFIKAWQELRGAVFGLERESAQTRLNQATSVLVLILAMAVIEFVLVSFIAPAMPSAFPFPTPTLNLLVTPSTTLPITTLQTDELQSTNLPPTNELTGCIPGQIEIISPKEGELVSGVVAIIGTANTPNFGFYKFEIKRPEEAIWLTLQAGNSVVQASKLGDWDTSRLTPGEYHLGLVVVDNEANASAPCVILLRVTRAPDATIRPQ